MAFLVVCTRLYKSPCLLVGPSVRRSVGNTFASDAADAFFDIAGAAEAVLVSNASSGDLGEQFLHHCSCPTARDWACRVCGLVYIHKQKYGDGAFVLPPKIELFEPLCPEHSVGFHRYLFLFLVAGYGTL